MWDGQDMGAAVDGLIASAAMQGAQAGQQELDKATLVQKVKDWQRMGNDQKEQWWAYCKSSGNTNFDPGRHEAPFLQGFFDVMEGRAPMPTGGGGGPFAGGWNSKGGGKGGGGKGGGGPKVFMGGLPKTVTDEKVREIFSVYGTINEVTLKYNDDGSFRGFGFLNYADPESAQRCIDGTNDNYIDGKWIDCKSSDDMSKGGGKGKGKDKGKKGKGGGGGKGWDSWGMDWAMMEQMMAMMKGKKGMGKKGWGKGPY